MPNETKYAIRCDTDEEAIEILQYLLDKKKCRMDYTMDQYMKYNFHQEKNRYVFFSETKEHYAELHSLGHVGACRRKIITYAEAKAKGLLGEEKEDHEDCGGHIVKIRYPDGPGHYFRCMKCGFNNKQKDVEPKFIPEETSSIGYHKENGSEIILDSEKQEDIVEKIMNDVALKKYPSPEDYIDIIELECLITILEKNLSDKVVLERKVLEDMIEKRTKKDNEYADTSIGLFIQDLNALLSK